jgi:hypothetical protein
MLPGNTANATVLLRLSTVSRERFHRARKPHLCRRDFARRLAREPLLLPCSLKNQTIELSM